MQFILKIRYAYPLVNVFFTAFHLIFLHPATAIDNIFPVYYHFFKSKHYILKGCKRLWVNAQSSFIWTRKT